MKHAPEFFCDSDLESLDHTRLPQHIAIIPDGNRRWAKARFMPTLHGHIAGADTTVEIIRAAKALGIKTVTLYAFSTENWKRPGPEVDHLMHTIEQYLERYQNKLAENGIRLWAIGNLDGLGKSVQAIVEKTCQKTAHCSDFNFVLAINYGGKDEICRAVKRMLTEKLSPDSISEKSFSQFLDTGNFSDPDLIIRTSGEMRLSNFLLWQSAYSELYIDSVQWPEFTPLHLLKAVREYQTRVRRIGGA